jgi:hypothetical protein
MSGISSGSIAIIYNKTEAQLVSAQRFSVGTARIQSISADLLIANELIVSGDAYDMGVSTAVFTIKSRTINIGDSNSTVIIPNETKFVSQETFSIPDPNFRINYGNIQGIVSTGFTVLSQNSASQPAYMNIHSSLGWTLSCPTNRAKSTQFTATSLLRTSVFQAVATTLSTASLYTTGNLTVSNLSVTQANAYNLSIPYVSFPDLRVVSTASIGTLSATTVNASLLNFSGTIQLSNTFTSTPSGISTLSGTNVYSETLRTNDLYNGVVTTKPNDIHVNTVGSLQHLRILSSVFVSDTLFATNTYMLAGTLSTKTLNVSTAATIVQLSIGTFTISINGTSFSPYALNIVSLNGNADLRNSAITSTIISGNVTVTSNFLVNRFHNQGLVTALNAAGGFVGNVSYLYVSAPLSILYQNTIGNASFTNMSVVAGILSTQSLNVTNMSISGVATVTNLYATNLSIASEIVVQGTLSVNERVSAGPAVLGSTLQFSTTPSTPALRMDYGTATTGTDGYCDITFTRAFGAAPTVHVQALRTSTAFVWAALTNAPTSIGVTSVRTYVDHTPLSQITVHWFAVGI